MNSIVYEKIIFVKEYWGTLLAGKIDIFDEAYIIDLNTILHDIYNTIELVKDNNPNNTRRIIYGDLPFVCKELLSFLEKSYYWDSDIGNVLHQIKTCIESNNFFKNVRQNDRTTIKIVFSIIQANIKTCINNIKYNNSHFYEILKKLKIEYFNSYKLNDLLSTLNF